jgi:hypothetical protein
MFQVVKKVTGGKPCATRRSSGGRQDILKALLTPDDFTHQWVKECMAIYIISEAFLTTDTA